MLGRAKEKPVFVPLAKQAFEDFGSRCEKCCKRWEIRRAERQWSSRNLRAGRKVTLSCGYGKKRRIHGKVGQVVFAPSLWEIFDMVPWREAEPRARSKRAAIKENLKLLGPADKYAAFEVILKNRRGKRQQIRRYDAS